MKKAVSLFLALLMGISLLSGCSPKGGPDDPELPPPAESDIPEGTENVPGGVIGTEEGTLSDNSAEEEMQEHKLQESFHPFTVDTEEATDGTLIDLGLAESFSGMSITGANMKDGYILLRLMIENERKAKLSGFTGRIGDNFLMFLDLETETITTMACPDLNNEYLLMEDGRIIEITDFYGSVTIYGKGFSREDKISVSAPEYFMFKGISEHEDGMLFWFASDGADTTIRAYDETGSVILEAEVDTAYVDQVFYQEEDRIFFSALGFNFEGRIGWIDAAAFASDENAEEITGWLDTEGLEEKVMVRDGRMVIGADTCWYIPEDPQEDEEIAVLERKESETLWHVGERYAAIEDLTFSQGGGSPDYSRYIETVRIADIQDGGRLGLLSSEDLKGAFVKSEDEVETANGLYMHLLFYDEETVVKEITGDSLPFVLVSVEYEDSLTNEYETKKLYLWTPADECGVLTKTDDPAFHRVSREEMLTEISEKE